MKKIFLSEMLILGTLSVCIAVFSACRKSEILRETNSLSETDKNIAFIQSTDEVSVNFATDLGNMKYKASGILNGLDTTGSMPYSPPDMYVGPIKPQFSRVSVRAALKPSIRDRHKSLGIKTIVLLEDAWEKIYGYNHTNVPGEPYDPGFVKWNSAITKAVKDIYNYGYNPDSVQFDVWNEGNTVNYWNPANGGATSSATVLKNRKLFCQMFTYTVKRLRFLGDSLNKKMTIQGPAFTEINLKGIWEESGPTYPWMRQWMDSVKAQNAVPDFMTWHFPGTASTTPSQEILNVEALWPQGIAPTSSQTMPQVLIDEYVEDDVDPSTPPPNPGRVGWLIAQQQISDVAGSIHAQFGPLYQLDALIYKSAGQWKTRGEWWLYQRYASLTGREVSTTNTPDSEIGLVAARDAAGQVAKVLLGKRGNASGDTVSVTLNGLNNTTTVDQNQVFVYVERIPFNGGGEVNLADIDTVQIGYKTISGTSSLKVKIPWTDNNDAYIITLQKKPSTKIEAESISGFTTYPASRTFNVNPAADPDASNSYYRTFAASASTDSLRIMIGSFTKGKYLITLHAKEYIPRGIYVLRATTSSSFGGTLFNAYPMNMYSSTAKYEDFNISPWIIGTDGSKALTFKVTGKDPLSTGTNPFSMVLDYIRVTKIN
ncbi:hypothetical protein GS399_04985 [Pedobacter sp. HMF7647]|uniref:Cellulase family glycosylhydrolase n=1 Tax=Hufsiella arboris TaxID=2695275 RepID=A0A7K1Y8E2_9SPHI|nr:hypothetical protein [Hufsiella arboris]MXV50318.1 hypothetical protein [Hufsiella arboris]